MQQRHPVGIQLKRGRGSVTGPWFSSSAASKSEYGGIDTYLLRDSHTYGEYVLAHGLLVDPAFDLMLWLHRCQCEQLGCFLRAPVEHHQDEASVMKTPLTSPQWIEPWDDEPERDIDVSDLDLDLSQQEVEKMLTDDENSLANEQEVYGMLVEHPLHWSNSTGSVSNEYTGLVHPEDDLDDLFEQSGSNNEYDDLPDPPNLLWLRLYRIETS